jgi:hypothetical protein
MLPALGCYAIAIHSPHVPGCHLASMRALALRGNTVRWAAKDKRRAVEIWLSASVSKHFGRAARLEVSAGAHTAGCGASDGEGPGPESVWHRELSDAAHPSTEPTIHAATSR